ncbi:hypothetical protein B0H10DRAFT_1771662 [Mycena sp. CBHHK59/15]|nr:hypothetical protein B0H10DRAFT_1771662 [Mycena sp. CBHHK59/15]
MGITLPWQLKDLLFAEVLLIAKVCHSRCVIHVAYCRGKLSVNAIMFTNPTHKVYNILPPSSDEISEILAFVFLGPTHPTEEEFAQTPMLVRRQQVKATLDWLILNHSDDADLEILIENLDVLPENGVPFGVDWKKTAVDKPNRTPEQMSVDNDEDSESTFLGPCNFSVHGLTGEEYGNVSMKALKAKTLEHLASGGKTLGVGHSETPESLYNNLQFYPKMLPWLFPYVLGGIGHPFHKCWKKEGRHKCHLLMYHDKQFKTKAVHKCTHG